ncbi:MAG: type 1 glutamine amidotransferase [Planctomycetota bacterium]|jgi:type 1 glutamine amidotransferase
MNVRSTTATLLLVILLAAVALGQTPAKKHKVLLVTGANNHDWQYSSKYMENVLTKTGRFTVTTTTEPGKYLAQEDLAQFDVIYLDYNGPRWGAVAEKRFTEAVQGGVGVSVIHAANNAFVGWEEYEMLSVFCWRKDAGHGKFHRFDVDVVDRNHPITRDLAPMKAHPDELYHKLSHMHGAPYNLLMTAKSSRDSGGSGRVEPMALTTMVGKGRVFHTPLGHVWSNQPETHTSLADPQLQLLIARGTEWAATGDCTIEPKEFGQKPYVGTLAKRPVEVWVRRCVLDGRARMIVLQLDESLSVAFDASTCKPYRVWGGTLKLEGTVFDGVHGPQPTTVGIPYASAKGEALIRDDKSRNFLGYRFDKGKVTMRYNAGEGLTALVEETFEHAKQGSPVLERRFKISGLPEGKTISVTVMGPAKALVSPLGPEGNPKTVHYCSAEEPSELSFGNGEYVVTVIYPMGKGDQK